MEYIIEIKFEDKGYNALIHFVSTFVVNSEEEASLLVNELVEGFKRNGTFVLSGQCIRIDNDEIQRERQLEYFEFCKDRATASIEIEQFLLNNPDQTKTLIDNLTEQFFKGEKATANIGNKYKIPVRVTDKKTRNPISGEFFYYSVEHLIPKN